MDERNLTGYSQVLEELVSGTVQRVYTYGLNRISQSEASGTSFYGYDGHGSVRLLNEILALKLDADLVVLSACQTARGKLIRGEGIAGLTRAFLSAGTPRVVASLWDVNDAATTELMKTFYRKMTEGLPPAQALQEAKRQMLHSGVAAYRHPYFWAAFVLIGENP